MFTNLSPGATLLAMLLWSFSILVFVCAHFVADAMRSRRFNRQLRNDSVRVGRAYRRRA